MSLLNKLVLLATLPIYGQTAISELTAYWKMEVSNEDRILWDSHGSKHGHYTGTGMQLPATIFGRGVEQSASAVGGFSIPADMVNTSGSFAIGVWCIPSSVSTQCIARSNVGGGNDLWNARFSAISSGRLTWAGRTMASGAYNTNADQLRLVWIAYDGTNTMVAVDDSAWTSGAAPGGFTNTHATVPLDIAQNQRQYNRGATVGDMMFWDGYIPSDAERGKTWLKMQ